MRGVINHYASKIKSLRPSGVDNFLYKGIGHNIAMVIDTRRAYMAIPACAYGIVNRFTIPYIRVRCIREG